MDASSLQHWLWLLPLALGALWIGSPRFLGTRASERLARLLRAGLDRRSTTHLQHLDLSVGGSVRHFDHLVLSRTGIHVIDALYLPGRIKGQRMQAWWQRLRGGRKHRFANPVHENFLRLQALQGALQLSPACFQPYVAISGHTSIDTDAKDVVIDVAQVCHRINSQTRPLLTAEELNQALLRIQQLRVQGVLLGSRVRRWRLLRLLLLALFLGGLAWVYQQEVRQVYRVMKQSSQPPDPSMQLERWENSLICSYSVDTQRCACYTQQGEKADISAMRCQQLAERGSVLNQ